MKKLMKKLSAVLLVAAMVCTTFLSYMPLLDVLAAPKMMAHLKAGSGNANGHFGSATPEAFVLSSQKVTGEDLSAKIKVASEKAQTRLRFVTKYVDDTHWGFLAYDGASGWFYQYKNGTAESWPSLSGLPAVNKEDVLSISTSYKEDGLNITVENETTKQSGKAVVNNENVTALKTQSGKIGFGAGKYNEEYTDIYFSDVKAGETVYTDYSSWTLYKDLAGQVWEPSVEAPDGGDGGTDPEPPSGEGRAWIELKGGSKNGGGHAYGDASKAAPVLLLDNDKKMEESGELSLAVKPSGNWGVFYTYVNDNNWLYVGYDSSSKWYYQYKLNGEESYPGIPGLPTPVEGEELQMSISLNRETLSVTVNGVTQRVTNQSLIKFSEQNAGKGRFGVKTNGATTISFADVKYGEENCMEDKWVFCAERDGQSFKKTYSKLVPLTGTVTEKGKGALADATVRVGNKSATTDANGKYQFDGLELGTYNMAVSKPGYQAFSGEVKVEDKENNVKDIELELKAPLDLTKYDSISSDEMKVYIGKEFPVVARYQMLADGQEIADTYFRGNETELNQVAINGVSIVPTVKVKETTADSRTYAMHVEKDNINLDMDVKVSVKENDLTWEVVKLEKAEGCAKIATIDVPGLNLLTVDAVETGANFAGAKTSTTTTASGDVFIDFKDGFEPSETDGYLYGFLTNEKLSAGLYSNSEIEGDKRVIRNNGADTMSLTSSAWYYELGDKNGQKNASKYDAYPVSELPCTKVAIAADANGDETIDWNDGALAFRDIMNIPYGSENIKDLVNYRIVMNFASMASNPYHTTADNIKKVYLATDGLPQAVMLKGYGNEGHDSANSEYADIAEREGGVEDFQELIKIAHYYNTEIGIHVNAQEIYPEAASFNEKMIEGSLSYGWGWLDQSVTINKLWDLSSQARWKRFVQLYDRINNTEHLSIKWPEAVKDSQGTVDASKAELKKEAESLEDNMDFIYLDVWYQDAWETRRIAEEINSLGWRFSTEFSAQGEYDSTWQHWSTDAAYGGATSKGFNSDIIRFIRNDQRDSQVLNYPQFGGTADNPLLGGYRLYGFEGWGGDKDYDNYILQTFNQNLPTKFLQHYYVTDWENYEEGKSPVGNHEKQITLRNDNGDKVVVTRNEEQRDDENIERTITLNDKKVLDDVTYLLPWTDNQNGNEKLYHWNLDGGQTTWELPNGWEGLANVVMYELSDQGRINETSVAVSGGKVTLDAKAATAYVLVKGNAAGVKELANDFGEYDYVTDPGFNGYAAGERLSADEWSGDINDNAVVVEKADTGDQRLAFNSPMDSVSVTTTISGLKKGADYVAEVYVENNSDAKASIEVNAGEKKVSNYTERSILNNYVKSDQKNGSKMQRMQVSFTAESETAQLTLSRAYGDGSTYMDDIRVVEKSLNNFQKDGVFKQDFETVVQGLYPFVLSSAQGISDPVTHLSQKNEPYTQAGWGGRLIDDVIEGEWSVKHHGANTGIIYQTLPQNFRFEPGKVYTVEFDYQSGPDKGYAMVIGDGTTYTAPTEENCLAQARGKSEHVKMEVVGSGSGQTWIGLYSNGKAGNTKVGETDFTLDNLVITEEKDAVSVILENTELYKGETAKIYGNNLDQITWKTSDDKVAVVDKEAGVVKALSAGTATLTAKLPKDKEVTFKVKVADSAVIEIPREELKDMTSSANTEETQSENAGAINASDGDTSTIWHSGYSGGQFVVSKDNPAVLTVDLGKELSVDGFKFQQRPSTANGIVYQYRYEAFDEAGNKVASSETISVDDAQRAGGKWITNMFEDVSGVRDAKRMVRTIKIYVEEGKGNFAAIAEVVPLRIQKVAETVTLDDATIKAGEKVKLEVKHEEGTILTGLVWASSNEKIARINQNGVVVGVEAGTATITVKNAAGLKAECTVTVILNTEVLKALIEEYEKLDLSQYQDGKEKETFIQALKNAKAVINTAKTQKEIDAAVKALQEAKGALKPIDKPQPSVDKSKLEKFYKECLAYYKETNHSKENWAKYQAVLADVKAILENESATQNDVDNALKALIDITKVMNKELEDAGKEPTTPPTPDTGGNGGNNGSNNGGNDSVTTGDMTTWGMTAVIMLLAVGAVVVVIKKRSKIS